MQLYSLARAAGRPAEGAILGIFEHLLENAVKTCEFAKLWTCGNIAYLNYAG